MNFLKKNKFQCLLLLPLIFFLCCGCDRSPAPPYSRVAGQLLLDACEALENKQHQEALVLLRQLVDMEPGNSFAVDALRHEERRQTLQQANDILATGDYHQLRLFLQQAEKAGAGSPQLIDLQDVADALETLAAVWARRPWENAKDLENALNLLTPHQEIMAESSRFQEILRNMREELEIRRKQERDAEIMQALTKLDLATFSADPAAPAMADALAKNFPEHILRHYRQELPNLASDHTLSALIHSHPAVTSAGNLMALAIVGVLSWEQLSAATQKELAAELHGLSENVNLCQQWILTRQQDTPQEYEKFFHRLRVERPEAGLPPRLVNRYVGKHLVTGQEQQAWCWQSPCPGVSEWLARLQQIRMKAP